MVARPAEASGAPALADVPGRDARVLVRRVRVGVDDRVFLTVVEGFDGHHLKLRDHRDHRVFGGVLVDNAADRHRDRADRALCKGRARRGVLAGVVVVDCVALLVGAQATGRDGEQEVLARHLHLLEQADDAAFLVEHDVALEVRHQQIGDEFGADRRGVREGPLDLGGRVAQVLLDLRVGVRGRAEGAAGGAQAEADPGALLDERLEALLPRADGSRIVAEAPRPHAVGVHGIFGLGREANALDDVLVRLAGDVLADVGVVVADLVSRHGDLRLDGCAEVRDRGVVLRGLVTDGLGPREDPTDLVLGLIGSKRFDLVCGQWVEIHLLYS